MSPPRPRFDWPGVAVSVLVLAVAGWAAAGTPFRGDQALFADYARRMSGGTVLYRDLWDVANPGVFWFYQLAGTVFGFTEDGIHLFEWMWWVGFVQAVSFATYRSHALTRWPLAPAVLVGGLYYLTSCSDPSHLTKTEGLVAFPLFLGAWLAAVAVERPRSSVGLLLLTGVCGGVAVLFKSAFAACVLAGWLPPLALAWRQGGFARGLVSAGGLLTGVAAVLATAAGYFAAHGSLDETVHTLFVTPREIVRHAELAGFDRLAASVRWFVEVYSPVLALAVAGAFVHRRDTLVQSLGLMFAAAVPVILVQRWSWWTYHFLLLTLPAAVLAAYTWPGMKAAVWERLARPLSRIERVGLAVVGLVLFMPALGHGAHAYLPLITHRFGLTADDRRAARLSVGHAYAAAVEQTAWLDEPGAKPGPMFVAGDPLLHWLSGRPAATRTHGWSLELFTPELWATLLAELKQARPVYVFVDAEVQHYDRLMADRCPEMADWLNAEYIEARRSAAGVWYERR